MFPLHREVSGYAFKRSLRLHTKEAVQEDDKWGEVELLQEAIIQVLTLFLFLGCQEAILWILVMGREGISVHGVYVVNTVQPYLSEVAVQQIFLLLGILFYSRCIVGKGALRLGLALPHDMTWMDEGIVAHYRGGKVFACGVSYPIADIVMVISYKAALIAVQRVEYIECGVVSIAVGREV